MINDNLKLRGDVALVLKDKDGNIKDSREIHNLQHIKAFIYDHSVNVRLLAQEYTCSASAERLI